MIDLIVKCAWADDPRRSPKQAERPHVQLRELLDLLVKADNSYPEEDEYVGIVPELCEARARLWLITAEWKELQS